MEARPAACPPACVDDVLLPAIYAQEMAFSRSIEAHFHSLEEPLDALDRTCRTLALMALNGAGYHQHHRVEQLFNYSHHPNSLPYKTFYQKSVSCVHLLHATTAEGFLGYLDAEGLLP